MSNNAQLSIGSICLTDLLAHARAQHSAFTKSAANGKIYVSIKMWDNEEPNQHGQHISVQLNPSVDAGESEKGIYIGNLKHVERKGPQPISEADMEEIPASDDDLPF